MNTPLHDLHIHTNLSLCSSDPEQTVENIAAWAAAHGVGTIGISNHVWDCDAPAGSEFYAGQPFSHIMKIRDQIPADLHGVRLLIGAETEFAGGKIMLSQACKDQLDYLLVPHSHIHMVGLVLPKDRVTDEQVADYLVTSFCDLVSKGGNFLLDVGPAADGTIPAIMEERLLQMGDWLRVNGEAIYGTSIHSKSRQNGVYYTRKGDATYAILNRFPFGEQTLELVDYDPRLKAELLGSDAPVTVRENHGKAQLVFPPIDPETVDSRWLYTIRLKK